MRTAAAFALIVAAGAGGAAAGPAPSLVVHLDVAAVDARGRAVSNLKPSDFELSIDGTPQAAELVRAVQPASRWFAIFLDEYHISPQNADRVRDALTRFIDSSVGARDVLVVMKPLDPLLTIPLAKDRDEVREAIASFTGRKGHYEPRNAFERDFMGRSPDAVERLRRQVTVSALNALAVRVGNLGEGRKAILLVSEGFTDPRPARGEEPLPTVRSLERTANRQNVAVYTLDPSPDSAGDVVLASIAANTDGRAAVNDDHVDTALAHVALDSTAYYLITCRPSVAADGRFHSVQVRVKQPGVRVRSRQGFWAILPDEELRTATVEAPPNPADLVPRHISPLISPWFGMARAADGKTRVTFVWEPSRRVPGDRTRRSPPAVVTVKATAPDGSTAFEGAVQATGAAVESRDAAAKAVFDAPPGRLRLQMSITGADSKPLDVDRRDLSIRDLRQPVAIATPEVLRARSAREFRALAADADAAPIAAREFSRAERLLVRFTTYAPAGDSAVVSARLVSRAGSTMRVFTPAVVDGVPGLRQLDVPLAAFAPGDYTIELSVSGAAGSAKELLNFRVTG